MHGPRKKCPHPMFPDPKTYEAELRDLNLDPQGEEAANLVYTLTAFLGPFADGTHQILSPDCDEQQPLEVTPRSSNVVDSTSVGTEQRLCYTFETITREPPSGKEDT